MTEGIDLLAKCFNAPPAEFRAALGNSRRRFREALSAAEVWTQMRTWRSCLAFQTPLWYPRCTCQCTPLHVHLCDSLAQGSGAARSKLPATRSSKGSRTGT